MLSAETEVRVRYAETDAMGIVHHGSYIPWLEVGRIHLLDTLGLPYSEMEKQGYRLPVLRVSLQYRSPAHFDERVRVMAKLETLPAVRFQIHYLLQRGESLLADGFTEHAFVGSDGYPIRPPAHFRERIKALWPKLK